jgi:hypothetical protein
MRDVLPPKSLFEFQVWFAKHLTSPIAELDEANIPIYSHHLIEEIRTKIAPSPTLNSEERMGIYKQQYWWRLLTILQEHFPSLVRLFGYEELNHRILEPYLTNNPVQDWFLSCLGSDLPSWLEANYREKDAPLVLNLARLDAAYVSLAFLDKIPSRGFEEDKMLYLQPFVLLFQFDVDLFDFRTELLEHEPSHWDAHDFPELKKGKRKKHFVLFRHQEVNSYEKITPSLFDLLSRFKCGAKLCDLIPLLEKCGNILETFQTLSSRGWLLISSE